MDYVLINSNKYADDNFQYQTLTFNVTDTYGKFYQNDTYCGQRVFVLTVDTSETNALAS